MAAAFLSFLWSLQVFRWNFHHLKHQRITLVCNKYLKKSISRSWELGLIHLKVFFFLHHTFLTWFYILRTEGVTAPQTVKPKPCLWFCSQKTSIGSIMVDLEDSDWILILNRTMALISVLVLQLISISWLCDVLCVCQVRLCLRTTWSLRWTGQEFTS